MRLSLSCIVEGDGDKEAVPVLLRRLAERFAPTLSLDIRRTIKIPRSRLIREDELERAVEFAARTVAPRGGVLIILEGDDDCPAELGPSLLRRAVAARNDMPLSVVLAKREFEAWLLAGAVSLRGKRGLPLDLEAPEHPEEIRGAKEWLRDRMPRGRKYRETVDQAKLAAAVDLDAAERAPSFARLAREVRRLIETLLAGAPEDSRDRR